jgi:hypothetical protein
MGHACRVLTRDEFYGGAGVTAAIVIESPSENEKTKVRHLEIPLTVRSNLNHSWSRAMPLPTDIEMFVKDKFVEHEQLEALSVLENAKTHDGAMAAPRLLRCALVASDRTLKGLRYQVAGLEIDYRDVVLAGEYTRKKGVSSHVWDLSKPFENANPVKRQ